MHPDSPPALIQESGGFVSEGAIDGSYGRKTNNIGNSTTSNRESARDLLSRSVSGKDEISVENASMVADTGKWAYVTERTTHPAFPQPVYEMQTKGGHDVRRLRSCSMDMDKGSTSAVAPPLFKFLPASHRSNPEILLDKRMMGSHRCYRDVPCRSGYLDVSRTPIKRRHTIPANFRRPPSLIDKTSPEPFLLAYGERRIPLSTTRPCYPDPCSESSMAMAPAAFTGEVKSDSTTELLEKASRATATSTASPARSSSISTNSPNPSSESPMGMVSSLFSSSSTCSSITQQVPLGSDSASSRATGRSINSRRIINTKSTASPSRSIYAGLLNSSAPFASRSASTIPPVSPSPSSISTSRSMGSSDGHGANEVGRWIGPRGYSVPTVPSHYSADRRGSDKGYHAIPTSSSGLSTDSILSQESKANITSSPPESPQGDTGTTRTRQLLKRLVSSTRKKSDGNDRQV